MLTGMHSPPPLDCRAAVPMPIDTAPIRSPQAVHTALLRHFADKEIVEIGTRNGDGMACFARVAKTATAVELSPPYCAKLRERSQIVERESGRGFRVVCSDYRTAPGEPPALSSSLHGRAPRSLIRAPRARLPVSLLRSRR